MTRGLLVVVVGVACVLFSPQDHGFLQGQKEGQSGILSWWRSPDTLWAPEKSMKEAE